MPACPACAEKISSKEKICPYCGEKLGSSGERQQGPRQKRGMSGMTIAVIAAAACGVLLMCCGVLIALLLPAVQQAREAARRTQCKNNLKQIGLALHNYHDTYQLFPAAHLNGLQGEPKLSWRVSILPYIDEGPRFNAYQFGEAWDGPSNSRLLNPLPQVYSCPSHSAPGNTNTSYATITGDHSILGDGVCVKMREVTDGSSNTLMVIEACQLNIPWMKPQDIDAKTFTKIGDPNGVSSKHLGGVNVLLADGSVRFISNNVDPKVVQALITRDAGDVVNDY
jgi:prepilin-type processing-associated H-X9-DG protein